MGKPDPQKRKPLRDKVSLDEITDNIRNDRLTRSQAKRIMQENDVLLDDEDVVTSDDEEELVSPESHRRNLNQTYQLDNNTGSRQRRTINAAGSPKSAQDTTVTYTEEARVNACETHTAATLLSEPHESIGDRNILSLRASYLFIVLVLISGIVFTIHGKVLYAGDAETEVGGPDDLMESRIHDVQVTLKSLGSKYKNQKRDLWRDAYVGITNIIRNPKQPSIIILLGNESDPLDCLAVLLGNVSSNALNSHRLLLAPPNFEPDMGMVIENIRTKTRDHKAIIIRDLLNINVEALKAFHNVCDRINPLREDVIYIITIISDRYDKKSNPQEFIERELTEKLSGKMKKDAIQPLITRITDGFILTVQPEPSVTDCALPTK